MTRKVYIEELNDLNLNVVQMGTLLENALEQTIKALTDKNAGLAERTIEEDDDINQMEKLIELKCIRIIAKQQPVATDLRKVISILKMIADIERIADHCRDISQYIIKLADAPDVPMPDHLAEMIQEMKRMVALTLDSFIMEDLKKAQDVIDSDDILDDHFDKIMEQICAKMKQTPEHIEAYANYLMILKYVERMGDHATNIAEWIAYIVTGDLERYMDLDED